jgi:response regulator RpfG family c-di-GMP phosphodiesterase
MRHLAQVQRAETSQPTVLRLLAVQKAEYTWAILPTPLDLTFDGASLASHYHHQSLVLVDLSDTQEIQHVEEALPWILQIVDEYLTKGLSPTTLQEEVERAEQWRQSLTLRDQELGRRTLELEARRDQIQELEKNLQEGKERLEAMAAQLQAKPPLTDPQDAAG